MDGKGQKKIVNEYFLRKFKWNFPQNHHRHPNHQSQCFVICRSMSSDTPLVFVQCRPHRLKFQIFFYSFFSLWSFFWSKPRKIVLLKRFYPHLCLREKYLDGRTRLSFVHRSPFCPKSRKSAEKFHFSQKSQHLFFKTTCGISLLFTVFPCQNLLNWQTSVLVVHIGNFIGGSSQKK